jgi:protein PET117
MGLTLVFTLGTIATVHMQQKADKKAMHLGVLRDLEQQEIRKQRQQELVMQQALEAEYKISQPVTEKIKHNSGSQHL